MLRRSHTRSVRFYPQVQIGRNTQFVNPVSEANSSSSTTPLTAEEVKDVRKRLDWRLWNALALKNWNEWEEVISLYQDHKMPLDEVSYTLVLHGYLLSHLHPSSVSLLVLDRMKQDQMHSAIVKLNENLINSYFELSDMGIKSSLNGWQNVTRLAWMSAARLRKKRMQRVKQHFQSLPAQEVLKLTEADVRRLVEGEHALAKVQAIDDEREESVSELLDY